VTTADRFSTHGRQNLLAANQRRGRVSGRCPAQQVIRI